MVLAGRAAPLLLPRATACRAALLVRHCSSNAAASDNKPTAASARWGGRGSAAGKGSGKSLMGSAARGVRGHELEAMKSGEYSLDGSYGTDTQLEGADVLMEVLAEDHRASKTVEFVDAEMLSSAKAIAVDDAKDSEEKLPWAPKGPLAAQRKFLSHRGVSGPTVFAREAEARRNRLDRATEAVFTHRLPAEAKSQREHDLRARARQREHDVIENRIQEAMASGAFEDLPGRGKPLSHEENVWESMAGEAMAHRILKNAGCAPAWVERNKEIRTNLSRARSDLVHRWGACLLRAAPDPAALTADRPDGAAAVHSSTSWTFEGGGKPTRVWPMRVAEPAGEEQAAAGAEAARQPTLTAAAAAAAGGASFSGPESERAEWCEAQHEFAASVAQLNKDIGAYNLIVPAAWQHQHGPSLQ